MILNVPDILNFISSSITCKSAVKQHLDFLEATASYFMLCWCLHRFLEKLKKQTQTCIRWFSKTPKRHRSQAGRFFGQSTIYFPFYVNVDNLNIPSTSLFTISQSLQQLIPQSFQYIHILLEHRRRVGGTWISSFLLQQQTGDEENGKIQHFTSNWGPLCRDQWATSIFNR